MGNTAADTLTGLIGKFEVNAGKDTGAARFSVAAAEQLLNVRAPAMALSLVNENSTLSSRYKLARIVDPTPANVLWPEVCSGEPPMLPFRWVQFGSCSVAAFPSVSALRMAVAGRQK